MTDTRPPPIQAAHDWLDQWQAIGGRISISSTGRLSPWRVAWLNDDAGEADPRALEAKQAERLLAKLVEQPEMIATIRVIVATSAAKMVGQGMRGLGFTQDAEGNWKKENKA